MDLKIEKFPDLIFGDRRLIWDSRQSPDGRNELVFVPDDNMDPARRSELLARTQARFVVSRAAQVGIDEALLERVENPRRRLGEIASESLGVPSRHLRVLAVTGTNGKTTSAGVIRDILRGAGFRVAEIGTLGVSVWESSSEKALVKVDVGFTTPEAPMLQKLFSDLVDIGVTHVVMEASSHGIELERLAGVELSGALFTNLTQDHLDFHGTMENYEHAKARLFTDLLVRSKEKGRMVAAVLLDTTPAARRILDALPPWMPAHLLQAGRDFEIEASTLSGLRLRLLRDKGTDLRGGATARAADLAVRSPMIGRFQAENIAGSAELCRLALSIGDEVLGRSLASFQGASGRLERVVDPSGKGRHVFVDYAHTPDAVEKALATVRASMSPGVRLSVVLGCGGDRDRGKRPIMARAAADHADLVYFTSDNPRSENPEKIIDDMAAGLVHADFTRCFRIADRREAINRALMEMGAGDVCVVAGKGHETYQIIGTEKHPFSDQLVCSDILRSS